MALGSRNVGQRLHDLLKAVYNLWMKFVCLGVPSHVQIGMKL
jgi:hypothetical protein